MIDIAVKDLGALSGLKRLARDTPKAIRRGLQEIGEIGKAEAKKRCNISPTKAQATAARKKLKGKRNVGFNKKAAPGELSNAISYRTTLELVRIGIYHGNATKYADFIHNGQGSKWKHLGPGSESKQAKVGETVGGLFLDRAVEDMDLVDIMNEVIEDTLKKG